MSLPLVTGVAPRWESSLAEVVAASPSVRLVRRCADVPELVGVCAAGRAGLALVSSDLRGLDRAAVEALRAAGTPVLAVHPPGDEDAARRLRRWGVEQVLPADLAPGQLEAAVAALGEPVGGPSDPAGRDGGGSGSGEGGGGDEPADLDDLDGELRTLLGEEPGAVEAGTDADDPPEDGGDLDEPLGSGDPGEVVVVWGAYGSPGRTTVAVNLAAELGDVLRPALLVDADTYGASVAQALGVLDEAPGLAAACRSADVGALDLAALARLAPEVRPGLRVLTGLPRGDRWPEIRDAALADVLEQARGLAAFVVVDVAPVVEQDEELSFDTAAPRRNGATLTALDAADRVVVVGSGDPLGLQRLVRALDQLRELTSAPREVVVTRVRPGPVGPEPGRRIHEALQRFAGAQQVRLVPEDREAVDATLLQGRVLAEVRPASPARQALAELAASLAGRETGAGRRGRRARWGLPRRR